VEEPPGFDLRKHYRSLAFFEQDVGFWTDYAPL
jgi:hypothetical protein